MPGSGIDPLVCPFLMLEGLLFIPIAQAPVLTGRHRPSIVPTLIAWLFRGTSFALGDRVFGAEAVLDFDALPCQWLCSCLNL